MMFLRALTLVIVLALAGIGQAQASSFVVTLEQQGSNVVATGTGSVNLTGLTYGGNNTTGEAGVLNPSQGFIGFGDTPMCDIYDYPYVGPSGFGPGSLNQYTSSVSGDFVGIVALEISNTFLEVPFGYTSDSPLSDSATWDNASFTGFGITAGTYTWSWDGGANTFTVDAVPEPSRYGFFIVLAVASLVVVRRFSPRMMLT